MEDKKWIGACALILFGVVIGFSYKSIIGKNYTLHLPDLEKVVDRIAT